MFTKAKTLSQLDHAIDKAYQDLDSHPVGTEKYNATLDGIVKLHKMQVDEKPDQVTPDTIALIAANLLGILLIIRHEHVNVISSKAMSTLIRPR